MSDLMEFLTCRPESTCHLQSILHVWSTEAQEKDIFAMKTSKASAKHLGLMLHFSLLPPQ